MGVLDGMTTLLDQPVNPNDIIVGRVNIFRSTNGGTSFSKMAIGIKCENSASVHADHHIIVTPPDYDGNLTRPSGSAQ
jgi:hypothetical protein